MIRAAQLPWRTGSAAAVRHARRVPVILQMTAVECAAACLAMVLTFYARRTTLAEAREALGVGRDGVTAAVLVAEGKRQGLRVKAVVVSPEQFDRLPLPAIVHWEFNHFVVVERWSDSGVQVVDPARGRRTLSFDEFAAGYSGVAVALEPGARFEPRATAQPPVWQTYLGSLLRLPAARNGLLRVLMASAALQMLGLVLPLTTGAVVDGIVPDRQIGLMPLLGLGLAVAALSQGLVAYFRGVWLVRVRTELDLHLVGGLLEHTLRLPLRFFERRSTGDLLMRIESTADLREVLSGQVVSLVLDGLLVLGYLAILLVLAPTLGLLVFGIALVQGVLAIGMARWMHRLLQHELLSRGATQGYLAEVLSGIATLKSVGAEDRAYGRWRGLLHTQLDSAAARGQVGALVDATLGVLRTFAPLLVLCVGALQVLDGSVTLGSMLALVALATALLVPVNSLVATVQQLQLAGAYLERLTDILHAAPERERSAHGEAPRLMGAIDVHNVSFRYSPHAPDVVRDVSLRVEPGQMVALVGPTGSGKSSLARVMLGLEAPTHGEVRYDGVPLQQLDLASVRRQNGVVLQESALFSGSIRDNIALHDPDVPLERVVEAAKLAAVHYDIVSMPMGYETRVAEGGIGLSGGQRQRLALARALVRDPAVLLLDEATSHLDAVTEAQVQRNLHGLRSTRLVIAHRLSTIREADLIVVLEDGAIIEQGTHADLLAHHGRYAELAQV